ATLSDTAAITTANDVRFGSAASENVTVGMSGTSSWSVAGTTDIGRNGDATTVASLSLSQSAGFSGVAVNLGSNGSSGTLNLNGGTIAANQILKGSGSGTIAFNGGKVQAKTATTNFFSGFATTNTAASVLDMKAGGLT